MEQQYVALWYGCDGVLGRTILCKSWEEAVIQCIRIADENGEVMTDEQTGSVDEFGDCMFDTGCAVHIGGLESPIEG